MSYARPMAMPMQSLNAVIACLRDSTAEPQMWSEALPLIAGAFNAAGAACFARNDQTNAVEWAHLLGPLSAQKANYIEYYATLDLYAPILAASPHAGWQFLCDCIPESVMQQSEWYQDFIRPSGIRNALSVQLHQTGPYHVFFGIHFDNSQATPSPQDERVQVLLKHLEQAARLASVQRTLSLRTVLGSWAIAHLEDALFVAHDSGRVVEMNAAGERIVSRSDALAIRNGRLIPADAGEAAQLQMLLAKADDLGAGGARMLVGRNNHRHCHLLTVFPLQGRLASDERTLVMIQIVDLLAPSSSGGDLADLFGLSPAEVRLAQALVHGKTLQDLTIEFSVKMPTLRSQLRSILRKCGVQRQVDLVRLLLRAQ